MYYLYPSSSLPPPPPAAAPASISNCRVPCLTAAVFFIFRLMLVESAERDDAHVYSLYFSVEVAVAAAAAAAAQRQATTRRKKKR